MQFSVLQKEETISIQGAITFETVAAMQKTITRLLKKAKFSSEYRMNLAGVTQVNSAALGLLTELKKQASLQQQSVIFLNPPQRLLALAQVCGVADWLGFLLA